MRFLSFLQLRPAWLWGVGLTTAGATAGVWPSSMAAAYALGTIVGLVFIVGIAGPIAYGLSEENGTTGQRDWRKRMVPWIALVAGAVGGVVCFGGALITVRTYATEQAELRTKRENEQTLLRNLDRANRQLAEAQAEAEARAAAAERRPELHIRRTTEISGHIAQAIERGQHIADTIQAALEQQSPDVAQDRFDEAFTRPTIDPWRERTHHMLEREFPGFHLGPNFSAIRGQGGSGRVGWGLSRVILCVEESRLIQHLVPQYVSQMIR